MKIMHLKRYCFSILVTAFLVIFTGNAFAAKNATRNMKDGDVGNTFANNFLVTSPYWQVDSGSYTFIAVSHSSLSGMASQIGVRVNAISSSGSAYDDAESFTVQAGSTQRLFIVPTNHATVNSTNITSGAFLAGTSDFTYGHIRVEPVATHPELIYAAGYFGGNMARTHGEGLHDSTTLTYWGSVIIEANTTGFAMEFIGDMNDSTTPAVTFRCNRGQGATHDRFDSSPDCNRISSSGVNLQ